MTEQDEREAYNEELRQQAHAEEEAAPSSCTVDSLVGASDKRMDRLLAKVEILITRETRHLTAAEAGDVIDYICEELGHYKEGL